MQVADQGQGLEQAIAMSRIFHRQGIERLFQRFAELAVIRRQRRLGKFVDRVIDEVTQIEDLRDLQWKAQPAEYGIEDMKMIRLEIEPVETLWKLIFYLCNSHGMYSTSTHRTRHGFAAR